MTSQVTNVREPAEHSALAARSGMRLALLIAGLLTVAFALGGGGVRYGLANLAIQLTALTILGLHREAFFQFWKEAPLALRVLCALSVSLPVLYLIPLPETLWAALPGRSLVAQSREVAGLSGWAAASIDPARTLVALSGLIVPLTILSVGWAIPRRDLMTIGWFVVFLGIVCFVIGIPQVLSGGTALQFYEERSPASLLVGPFANRNSTGIFLVSALALAALLPLPLARPHPAAIPVRLGICALLILGVVFTQSRTALALCLIPVALGGLRAFFIWRHTARAERGAGSDRYGRALLGAAILGAIVVGGAIALAPGRIGDTLERFEHLSDSRIYLWDDATYSAQRFWPVGAGPGTFDEVFQVDESLENLGERRAGRAHNDYIELSIETGAAGLILAAAWLVLIGWFSWRARRSQLRWAGWASGAILISVALQSVTDYPLRNQAMLAIAAVALLILARIASSHSKKHGQ